MHLETLLGEPHAVAAFAVGHRQRAHARREPRRLALQEGVGRLAEQKAGLGVAFVPEGNRAHFLLAAVSIWSSLSAGTSPGTR